MSTDLSKVAVLLGGTSGERAISLMSGAAVLASLHAQGVNAHPFDPKERDLGDLKREGFSAAFIALHGRFGEDGTVQGALELLGIPYTGSGVMASSLAIDKHMAKRIWQADGLPTPPWSIATNSAETRGAFDRFKAQGHRMIVKPALEGSSLGLTKVSTLAQCHDAFEAASKLNGQALCEAWIEGEEVTCAVLGSGAEAQALPLIRIAAPDGNYDFHNKYFTDVVQYHVPSGLMAAEEDNIQTLVLAAYRSLGCRGWARADVMIDANSRKPYLLEINTSPGMTNHSLVPMAAQAAGLSFDTLCSTILQNARLDQTP